MHIAVIIKALRLDLNMLSQKIDPQLLHAQDIPLVLLFPCRKIDPVTEIPLIQDAVKEDGLPVQAHSGNPFDLPYPDAPQAKVGEHYILLHGDRHFV